MRMIIMLLFALLLFGCDEQDVDYNARVSEWQEREALCPPVESTCVNSGMLQYDIESVLAELRDQVEYLPDEGSDYWQTSCETIERGYGDCEDLANLALRTISDACISDNYTIDVRSRGLDVGETLDHFVTIIYFMGHDFEIDNLSLQEPHTDTVVIEYDESFIF